MENCDDSGKRFVLGLCRVSIISYGNFAQIFFSVK